MPLHVARLRDSDLAAEGDPEGCWYAVLLWAAAWHQLPAGSLPDNDAVLARFCGLGRDLRTFRRHRGDALRGFVLCDDGRLYHPVIAEQVVAAWTKKLEQRWRTECARIKKANQRNGTEIAAPTLEQFLSLRRPNAVPEVSPGTAQNVPGDNSSKREGQGQGQGEDSSEPVGSGGEPPPDPEKVMFDAGLALLAKAGVTERAARPMLGKWKRDHGAEAVITALGKAQREGAIDPKSFIEGAIRNGQRPRSFADRPSAWSGGNLSAGAEPYYLDEGASPGAGGAGAAARAVGRA
jgi:hypothetical protein